MYLVCPSCSWIKYLCSPRKILPKLCKMHKRSWTNRQTTPLPFKFSEWHHTKRETVRKYGYIYISLSANSILQSIQAYERTLSYNTVMTAFRIGTAYKELSNYSKSVQYFTMSQQLDPTFAATYQYRGQVHYSAGETSLAIEDFSRCIEHAPWLESKLHMNCHWKLIPLQNAKDC